MTLFITNNPAMVYDCVHAGLYESNQLAFVYMNTDQEPNLIIFAEYFQRYDLANILRAAAAQIPQAIPNYNGIIKL
jgi:hypothetical protein